MTVRLPFDKAPIRPVSGSKSNPSLSPTLSETFRDEPFGMDPSSVSILIAEGKSSAFVGFDEGVMLTSHRTIDNEIIRTIVSKTLLKLGVSQIFLSLHLAWHDADGAGR